MPKQRERHLVSAETVRELRRRLSLTQGQLADKLGVHRRTIIRGEQRGMEIPSIFHSRRSPTGRIWQLLMIQVTRVTSPEVTRVTAPRKPLRLSRELLRDRSRSKSTTRRKR